MDAESEVAAALFAGAPGIAPYADAPNRDLLSQIPQSARTILDVGCGTGALGAAYREINPRARLLGIERNAELAGIARRRLHEVACVDVEAVPVPFAAPEGIDCIIYGDVLQHLREPWTVVRRHLKALAPGGTVLVCIPNLLHWSIASRLLRGKWSYELSGLLDLGHVRWFTLQTARRGLSEAGLTVEVAQPRLFSTDAAREFVGIFAPALRALGIEAQHYADRATPFQYVLRASRDTVRAAAIDDKPAEAGPSDDHEGFAEGAVDGDAEAFPLAGQPTDTEPVATLENPSFQVRCPEILNAELIPLSSRRAMEVSWNRGTFEARPLNVYRFYDGYVAHEALVFDSNLRVLPSSAYASSEQDIRESVDAIRESLQAGTMATYSDTAVVVRARATNNYGHYMAEMFPRAFVAQQLIADRPLKFVVHRTSARVLDVVYQSLSLIGIGLDRIVITGNEPTRFNQVVALDGLTRHGSYMSPFVVEALEVMASSIRPSSPTRLFVSRTTARSRRLLNEDELSSALERVGYTIVDTSAMGLRDQIALFGGAERVIGVLGAAMTNIVFCRRKTRVAVLTPCAYPDTFFWFLATHKQHHYVEVRCKQQREPDGTDSWNEGFLVTQKEIDYLLSF